MNRKPKKRLRSVFRSVFGNRNRAFLGRFFGSPEKPKPKNRLGFLVDLKKTIETDRHFGDNPKNQRRPFSFSIHNPHSSKKTTETGRRFRRKTEKTTKPFLFSVYFRFATLVATCYQHMHTESFEVWSFWLASPRNRPRSVGFRFRLRFLLVSKSYPTETDRQFGEKSKTDRGHFHFRSTTQPCYQDDRSRRIFMHRDKRDPRVRISHGGIEASPFHLLVVGHAIYSPLFIVQL